MSFELIHKPTFTNQLLGLPHNQVPQILKKIELLRDDPAPHGDLKKKLEGFKHAVYRLRHGDYRVVYTYGNGWVTLLAVGDRKDVYPKLRNHGVGAAVPSMRPPAGPPPLELADEPRAWMQPVATSPAEVDRLPIEIDTNLLERLRIPKEYVTLLSKCRTLDDLVAVSVPESVRQRVFDCVASPDLDRVLEQPDFVTGDVDNLLRFKDGDLLGFLLRLSPEQEKFVNWAVTAAGPTLVKGGPGTGKSTVALHRARSVLQALRNSGVARPRILFTTYTNALVSYSRQLLESLVGDDVRCVDVRTADSLVRSAAGGETEGPRIAREDEVRSALARAVAAVSYNGSIEQQAIQARAIAEMGMEYLLAEINSVIEARELDTLDAYLRTSRAGRKLPLGALQRTAIWRVRQAFVFELERMGCQTWPQVRARAEERVRLGAGPQPYDAVIVDEAQDLDASVLRMLVALCKSPNRLFLAADANQSIYGSGFRWADVHEQLQFRGRTGVLRANFRSTREIGEAAQSYLGAGILDTEHTGREYVHNGPLPAMREAHDDRAESDVLARFLATAAREWHLGLGSCAVLCPSEQAGRHIAEELVAQGREAAFMPGRELDLTRPGVKILTLQSAKGLEFPIVALAGFPRGAYPFGMMDVPESEREEPVRRARRTVFVGMTRAMRALLVVVPTGANSPVLRGFDASWWNLG